MGGKAIGRRYGQEQRRAGDVNNEIPLDSQPNLADLHNIAPAMDGNRDTR